MTDVDAQSTIIKESLIELYLNVKVRSTEEVLL